MCRVRPSVALLLAVGAACSESGSLQQNEEPSAVLVSAPIPRSALSTNSAQATGTVGFVSAIPGSLHSDRVVVRNRRTGDELAIAVGSGGFDPVPLAAAVGDTLSVVVPGTGDSVTAPIKREAAPRLVRTEPTASRTDVPLNSIITIVFSAPISLPSAASGIHLLVDGSPVPATIIIDGTNPAIIVFQLPSDLQPNAAYRVDIDASVQDLVGNQLGTAASFEFTTGGAPPPPSQRPVTGTNGFIYGYVWGYVVDESGLCIHGAMVQVVDGPGTGQESGQADGCSAWDYGGQYEFRHLPLGATVTLRATAPGYQPQERQIVVRDGGTGVEFDMTRQ